MLYLTTRNRTDSFTAHKVLRSTAAPDGGQFMPMQVPVLSRQDLQQLQNMSFGETCAYVMNLFFGTQLTGWDVDFAIGRQTVTMASIGHKVSVAESWHNPAGNHSYLVRRLYTLACDQKPPAQSPSLWFECCVHIALLFHMFGKYARQGLREFDIALETGDLQQLLAVRYASKMGLPMGKIILGSLDGDGLWEFFTYGTYAAGGKKTLSGLEALLWFSFGPTCAQTYLSCVQSGAIYHLDPFLLNDLQKDLFIAVVGQRRVADVTASAMRTDHYAMEQGTARAFGALQDYRAKTGENRNTLLLAHEAGKVGG